MSGGQSTEVRNCRTMAVFLGPRHTTADEREGRRNPSDITWSEPMFLSSPSLAFSGTGLFDPSDRSALPSKPVSGEGKSTFGSGGAY